MKKILCVTLLAFAFTLTPTLSEAAVTNLKHSKRSHVTHKATKHGKKHIARHHSRTAKRHVA
jgi:Ni/Co efflux regulator RcnB